MIIPHRVKLCEWSKTKFWLVDILSSISSYVFKYRNISCIGLIKRWSRVRRKLASLNHTERLTPLTKTRDIKHSNARIFFASSQWQFHSFEWNQFFSGEKISLFNLSECSVSDQSALFILTILGIDPNIRTVWNWFQHLVMKTAWGKTKINDCFY